MLHRYHQVFHPFLCACLVLYGFIYKKGLKRKLKKIYIWNYIDTITQVIRFKIWLKFNFNEDLRTAII